MATGPVAFLTKPFNDEKFSQFSTMPWIVYKSTEKRRMLQAKSWHERNERFKPYGENNIINEN